MNDEILTIPGKEKPIICVEPLTVRASIAAKMLGVSVPKVYELAARDDFQGAFKFGGCTLFSVEALRKWVAVQAKNGGGAG